MWPLTVFGGWVDRREEQIKMRWGGGAASWGELAAEGVSVHDDPARLTLIFWLRRCAKAMNRPAWFSSTKVPQAGQNPKAKSCETGVSSWGNLANQVRGPQFEEANSRDLVMISVGARDGAPSLGRRNFHGSHARSVGCTNAHIGIFKNQAGFGCDAELGGCKQVRFRVRFATHVVSCAN
jgi:hypothetical protein